MHSGAAESSLRYMGWKVVFAAAFGVMVSFAAIVPYTFSLFIGPLHSAFGWKIEAISRGFGITAITVAFCSPAIGHMLDKLPPRRVILPSIIVFAAGVMSLATLHGKLSQFYATYFLLGIVANGTAQLAYSRAVLSWFEIRRGLAIAVVLTGNAVGSILMPIIGQYVIVHRGWQASYFFLGLVALAGLPLTALFVKNQPAADRPSHAQHELVHANRILSSKIFWLIAIPVMFAAFSANSAIAHLAAILSSRGVNPASAALALSALGVSSILGRLLTGYLLDRIFAPLVSAAVLTLAGVGIAVVANASTAITGVLGAFLIGFGAGSESDVVPYLVAKYFDRARFGMIYGLSWTAYALGAAFGPVLMGRAFDTHHSYNAGSVALFALPCLLAALLQFALPPYQVNSRLLELTDEMLVNVT